MMYPEIIMVVQEKQGDPEKTHGVKPFSDFI